VIVSVPTGRVDVVRVAVVVALAPLPTVDSVAVPRVTPPLAKVTVPVGGAEAPATVGTVKINCTAEPKVELVGFAVSVSFAPEATATVSVVEDEIALKLPAAGAVAVMVSVPTGSAVVVSVATHEVAAPAGVPVKVPVPSVVPPLANVTGEVGHVPLMAATVSVNTTGAPKVSPVAGEAVRVPVAETAPTVTVAVGAGLAAALFASPG
jgi:hypothetical protein